MVYIKFSILCCVLALGTVHGDDGTTTGSTPNPSIAAKKAKGEITAGGEIAIGPNIKAKGGFQAGGDIGKFNGANAVNIGVGGGAVTGPVDGWKVQGEIGAGGNIRRKGNTMAEGGFKAGGNIASFKGLGTSGNAVNGKQAQGGIAGGDEIVTDKVKATGGLAAHGELLSITGAALAENNVPNPYASKTDVLAVQGIDTKFGYAKYYRRGRALRSVA